jgi:23S rRNA (uracil1939-C5)-methyltransferase
VSRKPKVKQVFERVEITDVGAEGKSVAKVDDLVVFTTNVIPGDVVDLQVTKKRKNYREARVINIHSFSKDRIEPFCGHYGVCGGCSWQILPYEKQLFYKEKQVADQLSRIGKTELPEVSKILASPQNTFYRNKLEFTFTNNRWLIGEEMNADPLSIQHNGLGLHVSGLFDKVVNVRKCWHQPEPSNRIRNFIYDFAVQHNLEFFDLREHKGFLRTMFIRTSSAGGVMVIVIFYADDKEKRELLLDALKDEFPEITSLVYIINQKGNATINDQEVFVYSGNDCIWEEMEGLRFKIGPKSFFQTNTGQAYQLYKIARDFARLTGNEIVYDLYTGTGTIANFVARQSKKVVGIEYVPEAIEDAKFNSGINNIGNTSFFAGDMKDLLTDSFFEIHGKPDVVITDPPRAGMHNNVVSALLKVQPERIVYVSCNPATQARDISVLKEKYRVAKIQPVDMFPHTQHVENIVLLELI